MALSDGPADPMRPRPARVLATRQDTRDTWTLELGLEDGVPAAPFEPGQFHMLWPFGVGESAISICGDPDEPARILHTVRAVGPVSRAIATAAPGVVLGLRGPFGRGWPIDEARGRDVLFVAGGIGLAPLRPAILRLLARRADYGQATLLYGARTPEDRLYPRELEAWSERGLQALTTVDAAPRAWNGAVGVVTELIARAGVDPAQATAFVCGPEVMMRFCALALERRGLAAERIHLSMERNMRCAVAVCGHCQYGPTLLCRDGPVLTWDRLAPLFAVREL